MIDYKNEPHIDKDFKKILIKIKKIYSKKIMMKPSFSSYQIVKNIINSKNKW